MQASDELHETTVQVIVNIDDENDNPPIFSQQSYQVALPELTGPHTSVLTVNATDKDWGDNAKIKYSMVTVAGFYIDPITGKCWL